MSPRYACLCRPRRLPHPARPREKPGFSTREGEIPRDTDSPLEGDGFELPVPRERRYRDLTLLRFICIPETVRRFAAASLALNGRAYRHTLATAPNRTNRAG